MKKHQITHRKLGPNKGDLASRPRVTERNFRQSRDIHEDRGVVQIRLGDRGPKSGRAAP